MDSKNNWVDFKTVKKQVSIEMVLDRYGLMGDLKKSGKNLVGCCPIHKGSNSRQFSVDPERNIFNCFGNCKAGGNVMDFVAMMEFENKETESIRKAALMLKDWFLTESADEKVKHSQPDQGSEDQKTKLVREEKKEHDQDQLVNPPLTFQLKSLDPNHSFFKEREILPPTVEYFGLGYCKKGMMKGRIAIPIHNENGDPVAYCGRAVNDKQIKKEGKYKMPPNFIKSAVLYNLHRQRDPDSLILVESFLSVFWLYQANVENVVALMGSSMSGEQEALIVNFLGSKGKAILLFDSDENGKKCSQECHRRFIQKLFVKVINISPYGKKPHQIKQGIIKKLI